MLATEVANAEALRCHVSHALSVGAVAMGRQRMSRAIAAPAALYVADERARRDYRCSGGRGAEERRLRSIELERDRNVVALRADPPAAAGDVDRGHGRRSRHETLVAQRLCATVPHAWQVRFCSEP